MNISLKSIAPHSSRKLRLEQYAEIDMLLDGGLLLQENLSRFVTQRLGESGQEYAKRLQKFSYDNLPGDFLKHIIQRFSLDIQDISGPVSGEWAVIRQNEPKLMAEIIRHSLVYGEVFLTLDDLTPTLLSPRSVQRFDLEQGWLVSLLEETVFPEMFGDPIDYLKVLAYTPTEVQIYRGKKGKTSLELSERLALSAPLPMVHHETPKELWLMNMVYSQAVKNLVLSCHLYDLCAFAYFQRSYKEVMEPGSNIPSGALANMFPNSDQPLKSSLAHILKVEEFNWNEPTGAIITVIQDVLSKAQTSIKDMMDVPSEPVGAYSGTARQMDFSEQTISVRSYLQIVVDILNSFYIEVSESLGLPNPPLLKVPEKLKSSEAIGEAAENMPKPQDRT